MGQKINPVGLRLQVNRTWESRWFANSKEYGDLLHEDLEIRKFIKKNCAQSGITVSYTHLTLPTKRIV